MRINQIPQFKYQDGTLPELKEIIAETSELQVFSATILAAVKVKPAAADAFNQLETILEKDESITRQLIQRTAQLYLGIQGITTLRQVISQLGIKSVQNLILTDSLINLMTSTQLGKGLSAEAAGASLELDGLIRHAITTAVIARELAVFQGDNSSGLQPEDYYQAALIHDLGKFFLNEKFPQLWRNALEISRKQILPLTEAERQIFGMNHSQIGAHLARSWNLSESVIQAIGCHHQPWNNIRRSSLDWIIYAGNILAGVIKPGLSGNYLVSTLSTEAFHQLKLTQNGLFQKLPQLFLKVENFWNIIQSGENMEQMEPPADETETETEAEVGELIAELKADIFNAKRPAQLKALNSLAAFDYITSTTEFLLRNFRTNPNCQIYSETIHYLLPLEPEKVLVELNYLGRSNPDKLGEYLTEGILDQLSELIVHNNDRGTLEFTESLLEQLVPSLNILETIFKLDSLPWFKAENFFKFYLPATVKSFCIENYHAFSSPGRQAIINYLKDIGETRLIKTARIEGRLDHIKGEFENSDSNEQSTDQNAIQSSSPDSKPKIELTRFEVGFQPTQIIFEENSAGQCMFIIKSGKVSIFKRLVDGKIMDLDTLGPGEIFGEMALLCHEPRTASARALETTFLYQVNQDNFDVIMNSNNQFSMRLIKIIASRLKVANEKLKTLSSYN